MLEENQAVKRLGVLYVQVGRVVQGKTGDRSGVEVGGHIAAQCVLSLRRSEVMMYPMDGVSCFVTLDRYLQSLPVIVL